MTDTNTVPNMWHPSSWSPWARGAAIACLIHIILATLATVARFGIASWSEACWDRYNQECPLAFSTCTYDPFTECYPPDIVSSVLAALQSGPGPVILFLPFLFLPSFQLDLTWMDEALLMFWIPELVSFVAYGSAGALAFNYLRPRIGLSLLLLCFVVATAATTLYWWIMFATI